MSKTYSAGIVTAYGAAKRAGYQGTYEDFCRQQAGYAGNAAAVEAAKTAAQTAANTATAKAGEATTAAIAAQTAKTQTEAAASQALTDIGTASSGAISAVQTEGATQTANATAQAQAAATSATTASTKASEASASATTATTKATEAAASATSAARSANDAQDVLDSIPADYSEMSADVEQLKADLGDCARKSVLNNDFSGENYTWELGTLVPGTVNESTGNTRIRSTFIPVSKGTKISLAEPLNRLLVYCYDANKGYVSDSPWLAGNIFEITDASVAFVRILVRKNTSNATISASEVEELSAGLTLSLSIPSETYTDMAALPKLRESLDGSRFLGVEIGSMSDGKPTISSAYVRTPDFVKADIEDVLTISPVGFGLYYGVLYKYSANNLAGYYEPVTIPAITSGNHWRYTFTESCWFKFRESNAPSNANITPDELYKFDTVFKFEHVYSSDELTQKAYPLGVDYETLNASITGKVNLAVQTDTHMAKNIAYTGEAYLPSDFNALKSVVGAVNSLEVALFANLGDIIRGYQADPDYESRLSADSVMDIYKGIRTNRAFVVGNHDDGCLFYHNSLYNDNRNSGQIMFPSEQFNRYTKYGINNAYIQNYYYKDISGIRFITLWQRDYDYSQSVPTIESFNIGQTQLNWLTGTALNTDLPVIIMCHAPLVSTLYSTSRGGFDAVLTALNAFVSGGGTVIAVLCGHTHARGADKVDGINHIVFKNGYDFFELVSVDTTNRTISCTLVGTSGDSRTFTY